MRINPLETASSDQLRNWLDGSAEIDLKTLRSLAKHAINGELRERYNRTPEWSAHAALRRFPSFDAEPRIFEYISDGATVTL